MNIQAMQQTVKTMTSREVSGLCDKEHRHVLRDIDDLNVTYGEMALPKIGQCSYKAENGQNYKQYLLTQEHCVDLITGYSREIRIRINRRWQELETQASQPVAPTFQVPQTLGEALQLAGTLQLQIEQDAPKVAFHDTVSASKSTMAVGDVAKKIGMSAQALNIKLVAIGAYDKRRLPKKVFNDGFINKGYGEMSLTADGRDRNRLTQAGQIYIVDLFSCKDLGVA